MSVPWVPPPPSKHARTREEAVLIAGGPVQWPELPRDPDLTFIHEQMPDRADRTAYLIHALRFFEDVLTYAVRLERDAASSVPLSQKGSQ